MTIKTIDRDRCDGCGICVDSCPNDVLGLDGQVASIVFIGDCHTCFLCEMDCPQGAVTVSAEVLGTPTPY